MSLYFETLLVLHQSRVSIRGQSECRSLYEYCCLWLSCYLYWCSCCTAQTLLLQTLWRLNEIKPEDTNMYGDKNSTFMWSKYRNQMKPDVLLSLIIIIMYIIHVRRNINEQVYHREASIIKLNKIRKHGWPSNKQTDKKNKSKLLSVC